MVCIYHTYVDIRDYSSPSWDFGSLSCHGYHCDLEAIVLFFGGRDGVAGLARVGAAAGSSGVWRAGCVLAPFPVVGMLGVAVAIATPGAISVTESIVNALRALVSAAAAEADVLAVGQLGPVPCKIGLAEALWLEMDGPLLLGWLTPSGGALILLLEGAQFVICM